MYTDINRHVIWGVDDGAETKEETFRMLREAVADGIGTIICTPHITPGIYAFPEEKFQDNYSAANAWIKENDLPLKLYQGAEILFTDATPQMLRDKRIPSMAGSRYILVEFSPAEKMAVIMDALQQITATGYLPIIAHLERYSNIRTTDQVREIKERFQAMIQINARSLFRRQPLLRRRFFSGLFQEGLVDFIATDTHAAPGRESCMSKGMEALRRQFGAGTADAIERRPYGVILKNLSDKMIASFSNG
jgi:protein-tyrosine phosphatase